jgi:RNA polymerase sigma-70 factor, ECF subfamily
MTDENDERVWVARCLKGDASAFEPLVARYERPLFAVALRLVTNYEDARDVTQNVFIRAYEHLGSFDPERRFFSWIYRIAVNESLNLRRTRRPQEALGMWM